MSSEIGPLFVNLIGHLKNYISILDFVVKDFKIFHEYSRDGFKKVKYRINISQVSIGFEALKLVLYDEFY